MSASESGDDSQGVYCASDRAIEAAAAAYPGNDPALLANALIAAHSASLGLYRSVCYMDARDALLEACAKHAGCGTAQELLFAQAMAHAMYLLDDLFAI